MGTLLFTEEQKLEKKNRKAIMIIKMRMDELGVNQTEAGRALHLSQSGFSNALLHMTFTYNQLLRLFNFLKMDPDEVIDLFKY